MDWSATMDRIEANGECAIVHDVRQESEGVHPGWDIWIDGQLRSNAHSQAEAEAVMAGHLRDLEDLR
jgi:hypothetical protein